jgi:hypothetical protein
MKRSAFDRLVSMTGLVVAAVLVIGGILLAIAAGFVNNQVNEQLSAQRITMPNEQAIANLSPADQQALRPYLGQPMTNGDQAKAFADHYIQAHLNAMAGGKTYEEVSGEYLELSKNPQADPAEVKQLGDLRQTMFMGATLRSMLLTAYAFGTMGTIAGVGALAAFAGAAGLAVLSWLGLRHARDARGVVFADPVAESTTAVEDDSLGERRVTE